MIHKQKILMVGPYPPQIGGIATFIKNISVERNISNDFEIRLHKTGISESKSLFFRGILELSQLLLFIFKFYDINIFHVHTSSYLGFYRNVLYVFFSKYFHTGKVILHVHGGGFNKFYKYGGIVTRKIIEFTLMSSAAIIVTSRCWVPIIKEISDNKSPIYAVPNGFDNKIFRPIPQKEAREKLSLPLNKKIILTIGDLENHKGQKFLIESMKNIVQIQKDVLVYIIGDGSLKLFLTDLINRNSLDSSIILISGNRPADELALWYNACDIFILPSLTEGNPTVMFECLACGKPFIGTRVGGIPDIIKSEEYGYIFEPANSDELCEKLLLAMNKEWKSEVINRYANQFTWEGIGKSLKEIYINIAN